jgi:ParB family chromosome partitioning protein
MGHARALAGIEDPFIQLKLYNEVVAQEMSVRALESRILSSNTKKELKTPAVKDPNVLAVQKKMEEFFGSKIEIQRNEQGKGHFVVRFNSDENFNDILEKLGII